VFEEVADCGLSSTKAKYRRAFIFGKHFAWMQMIIEKLGLLQKDLTTLFSYNQRTIQLVRNPMRHQKTKHIEIWMHYI